MRIGTLRQRHSIIEWHKLNSMERKQRPFALDNATFVVEAVLVVPREGAHPDGDLVLRVGDTPRFQAPIGALQNRALSLTRFDDFFGVRALHFFAEELAAKAGVDPSKLVHVARYVRAVRKEWVAYAAAFGGSIVPIMVPVRQSFWIENRSDEPITVELAGTEVREVV